jgi:type I restriction enzyme, R subunit
MNKKTLSERDICTRFITPALEKSGWDKQLQILEEVSFTDGKIYVREKITARGIRKRADSILCITNRIFLLQLLKQRTTTIQ